MVTKDWLNRIFLDNFPDTAVVLGILRAVARISYREINPQGPTMALAALSHKSFHVQEGGVRAFESWEAPDSLKVLANLRVSTNWLQEYIDTVVADLRRKYGVHASQENR